VNVIVLASLPLAGPSSALRPAVLDDPQTLLLALPGAGCSPHVFGVLETTGDANLLAVDYLTGPGPWTLDRLTDVLAEALEPRVGRTVVVGHSLGGALAIKLTAKAPGRVHGLVVGSTGLSTAGHHDPDLPQRIRESWTPAAADAFVETLTWRPLAPALRRPLYDYARQVDREAFAEVTANLREADLTAAARSIRCPTVVIHGTQDSRRSVEHARALAHAIAGARLVLLDAGHTPMVETPADYCAPVTTLVAEVTKGEPC